MTGKTISAEELDAKFEAGEDVSAYFDWDGARRPGRDASTVEVELVRDVVDRIDAAAERSGMTRQALIAKWLRERLDQAA